MNRRMFLRMPLTAVMSQLYGYIYSMLISNVLVGMPLFGGALYLCGRAATVLTSIWSRKNWRYLPSYAKIWGVVLAVILLAFGAVLMGLYPAAFQSPKVWIVFAAVALCLCADGMEGRIIRLRRTAQPASARAWIVTGAVQMLIIAATGAVLVCNLELGTALQLTAAFALLTLIRAWTAWRLYTGEPDGDEEESGNEEAHREMQQLRAYKSFEVIRLLITAAVELTVSAVYALLATGTEHFLPAIAVGIGCTLLAFQGSALFLGRSRKKLRQDPTWLLCTGLILWLAGVFICSRMLSSGRIVLPWIYICLALSSSGSTLCFTGLMKIDNLMPGVAEVAGQDVSRTYRRQREVNRELAALLGDVLSLITLSVVCFISGSELPHDMDQLAARYQPAMIVPLILVMIAALISAFRFPISARYVEKLQLFLRLKQKGGENPVLRRQLEHVVADKYRQPWLTRFLIWILKPFYRHTLVDTDHIELDDDNPLVFLGNHAEIYGPIVCILYFPVQIRTWTISMMMFDRKKVTAYLYENTFSKKTFLPVFVRKGLALFLGWLSVNVMEQLENIPVYKDSPMKLRDTIRQSVEAMESGDNLLIFPEAQEGKYQKGGIGRIAPGFVMLAEAYWKKTGKRLRMLPLYANREARTITFGETIVYQPERGFREEQERIVAETTEQINRMAEAGPAAG